MGYMGYAKLRPTITAWYEDNSIKHHSRINAEEIYSLWEDVASIDEDYFAPESLSEDILKTRMTNLLAWIKNHMPQDDKARVPNQPAKNIKAFLEIVREKHQDGEGDEAEADENRDGEEEQKTTADRYVVVEVEPDAKPEESISAVGGKRTAKAVMGHRTRSKKGSTAKPAVSFSAASQIGASSNEAKNSVVHGILGGCMLVIADDFSRGKKALETAIKEMQALELA